MNARTKTAEFSKKDKIRKFMKTKARELQTKAHTAKLEEIRTAKKVQQNLLKLSTFQRKVFTSGVTTPALKTRKHKKNATVLYEEGETKLGDKTVTPNKGLFEMSEASLNISGGGRAVNRSVLGNPPHFKNHGGAQHDTLYEDSRLSSIQTLE